MNGPARFWVLALTLTGMVVTMSGCNQLQARDQLNKGVDAYKSAHYDEAIEHFQIDSVEGNGVSQCLIAHGSLVSRTPIIACGKAVVRRQACAIHTIAKAIVHRSAAPDDPAAGPKRQRARLVDQRR